MNTSDNTMSTLKPIILIGCLMLLLPYVALAQQTLVFSAVEETITAKITQRILQEAYQKIGITTEIQELPGIRGLMYSNSGQTDGEAFRIEGIEKKYPNLCRIEIPICTHSLYLFVKKGRELTVNGWESIPTGYLVGHQRGIQVIEQNAQLYQIKTEQVRHAAQLFTMLQFDRVDAIIEGKYQTILSPRQLDTGHIVQLHPAIQSSPLYHYLHVKHADLIPQITAVLQKMKSNGELQKIENEVIAAYLKDCELSTYSGSGM
jgi:polar amino acid transport system substrate-binding protein